MLSEPSGESIACAKELCNPLRPACMRKNILIEIIDEHMRPLHDKIGRLKRENKRLLEDWKKQNDAGEKAVHVIIETGVVPGIDSTCRCDACKDTAIAMDDSGFLEGVKDRWWSDE